MVREVFIIIINFIIAVLNLVVLCYCDSIVTIKKPNHLDDDDEEDEEEEDEESTVKSEVAEESLKEEEESEEEDEEEESDEGNPIPITQEREDAILSG